ncbi:MAG: HEPN domain-containing protein [Ardenticatenales bacterium]|nr:HEPN domain-containing protein [Ardenticatenales bacterium]
MTKETKESAFRIRLAEGFLQEARQDFDLERWRSCVDNSQLATENAAKAVLALLGPLSRTHSPAPLLRAGLDGNDFPDSQRADIAALAECAEMLGPDVHSRSDYGDEIGGLTPWQLFRRDDAAEALAWAERALSLAAGLAIDTTGASPEDSPSQAM